MSDDLEDRLYEMQEAAKALVEDLKACEKRNRELEAEVERLRGRLDRIRDMIREGRRGFIDSKATRLVNDICDLCDDALLNINSDTDQ